MEPVPDEEAPAQRLGEPEDVPIETPADDVAEQALPAAPAEEEDGPDEAEEAVIHRGLEVNEADAVEQARTVGLDDEYE